MTTESNLFTTEGKLLEVRKRRRRFKLTTEDIILDSFIYISLIFLCVITIYPFLNTLAISLNDATDTVKGGIRIWPRVFTIRNYELIFTYNPLILRALYNSAARAIIGGALSVFACFCIAYVFSRKDFVMRRYFTPFLVFTMYFSGGLIPSFILMRNLGLINNFLVYILPLLVSAYNVMVMRSFIENLPDSLIEAAKIDGASEYTIIFRIVFPLSTPVIATILLFVSVMQWNSWFDTMIYCSSEPMLTTLQYELQKLLTTAQAMVASDSLDAMMTSDQTRVVTPLSLRTAMTIIAVTPILFIYPFLQRYFVKGLTIGGVKG